ncbi:GLPGLI family protein [Leptobacterium flavescens]|uniref:GLPGLI family protein n=1 Tax=Leptobacterium flavescens TaxID=472055 RepID=A0A6P0URE1_9FLAO|nr:GLPGLI family protein [Leptobacterium flavescens]NER15100.1 GLPGLI family protein [Leptobacterium flavescens]
MSSTNYILFLFTVIFFFVGPVPAQVKKLEATYKVEVNRKKNRLPSRHSLRIDQIFQQVDHIKMDLLYNNGKSSFKVRETWGLDFRTELNRKIAEIIADVFNDRYLTDIEKNALIRQTENEGVIYNITSGFISYKWKLLEETKVINGYHCLKAISHKSVKDRSGKTTVLEIIAWYTPEIPLPLGPKDYTGLPGLILQLKEDSRRIYTLSFVKVNPDWDIVIEQPREGKNVTKQEYHKITSNKYKELIDKN